MLPSCFPTIAEGRLCGLTDLQLIDFPEKTGAGEGIRTLDPNLGKVVLYP